MNGRLVTPAQLDAFTAEHTTAHRFWTGADGWVERFDADYLVSATDDGARIAAALPDWLAAVGLTARRTFVRRLVKQPGEDDKPRLLAGPELPPEAIVTERGLRFAIDFSAGYSVGLFCDQRANRAFLESLRPKRVLNCFAYTCAFSAAAARVGAETLSLDLSRRSLDRGRANLALNDLSGDGHRFLADDVFAVLPRLARRGEKFDAIILDPPTFSRGAKGHVFRAERDLGSLLAQALALATPGAHVLLSTNARELDVAALADLARGLETFAVRPPDEYPPGAASATLWITAPI
ncbi:MAG TPA: class I SAM-dependent methyltransferase [Chthoniobacterales bacterium]